MNEILDTIAKGAAVILGVSAVIGLAAKLILLPWIKSNLIIPVNEVNKQVTVNNNISDPATMLDTIHIIEGKVDKVATIEDKLDKLEQVMHKMSIDAVQVSAATAVIQRMWDHHLDWSEEEVNRLWTSIRRLEDKQDKE